MKTLSATFRPFAAVLPALALALAAATTSARAPGASSTATTNATALGTSSLTPVTPVALANANVIAGNGSIAGSDIRHPNGNTYDQVLMTGPSVTVVADPGQVVRVSFADLNDDIVQVEFSGAGSVAIDLDPATYRAPAPPARYHQPGINYVRGRPTVHVRGADATTFISIFSVGRGNAVNQSLFPAGMTYDAMADVQLLQVEGAQLAAILTGNVRFNSDTGATGIMATDTSVRYRVVVGDIDARTDAIALLRLGAGSPLEWDAGAILVAGGRLAPTNRSPIDTTARNGTPFPRLNAVAGTLSSGDPVPAGVISGQFASRSPATVLVNGTPRATRGFIPSSFSQLLQETGFDVFDFGAGVSFTFSGGNTGTFAFTLDDYLDGEFVHIRLSGTYSYAVDGANQNRMTFSMTFTNVDVTSASVSYHGTLYDLARDAGESLPVRMTVTAEFDSAVSGTASMTILETSGRSQTYTSTFDLDHELDFGFF